MNWNYFGVDITNINQMPDGVFGFIYMLHFNDGTKYIGKKSVVSKQTLPALKSGVLRTGATRIGHNKNGKRVYYDVITKESNWKNYEGSKKDYGNREIVSKLILEYAPSNRALTYLEAKYLFIYEAIEKETYLNSNILNKFFRDNLV